MAHKVGEQATALAQQFVDAHIHAVSQEQVTHPHLCPGLTDAVHAEGAKIGAQLGHAGLVANTLSNKVPTLAPSTRVSAPAMGLVKGATKAQIREVIADFERAAQVAIDAGFDPVKINTVVQRGVNDDEIVDLARFGRERGVEVRFIEWMPLDAGGGWDRRAVVSQDEIVAAIGAVFPLEPIAARGAAPADRWRYRDTGGLVGVIPSVTRPFCGDCDRVRLTADGQFRTCLFATSEIDLRASLRDGADDDTVAAAIEQAVAGKWAGHRIDQVDFVRPARSMSQIGG